MKTEEVRVRPPVKQGKLGSGPFKQRKLGLGPPLKLRVRVRTAFKTREVRVRCRFKMEVLGLGALL